MGVTQRSDLAPELGAIGPALPPALDEVRDIGCQYLCRPVELRAFRAGRCIAPQVGIDRGTADAQLPRDGGYREPLRMERVQGCMDRDP
jgi:hypothetical protein